MPLGYVVPALGRTGADLRAARGPHGLVATGPAARLGSLVEERGGRPYAPARRVVKITTSHSLGYTR